MKIGYLTQKTNVFGNTVFHVCSRLKYRTLVVRRGKSRCRNTLFLTSAIRWHFLLPVLIPVSEFAEVQHFSIISFDCFLITFLAPLIGFQPSFMHSNY